MALEATGLLTQDAEPGVTTLVDAYNGFNNLRHLGMIWRVHHRWPAGVRFALNFYMHWSQVLLCQPGDSPFLLLIRDRVTHGYPLSMVLYRITLVPLAENLRDADTTLLSPFYTDDVVFDGLERRSAAQLHLLMEWVLDQGYFPEPVKSLFVADSP